MAESYLYVSEESLREALDKLHATADHLLKIWFTLKQMGMDENTPAIVTTSSPTPALQRLFNYGDPQGRFYVPFAHTDRYKTMAGDAARSIIQTTIRRWLTSGSVVTVDPSSYLDIRDNPLSVHPGRTYPLGLGHGKAGFALEDDSRVSIPDLAFAIWYYRFEPISSTDFQPEALVKRMYQDLNISSAEASLIFVRDDTTQLISQPVGMSESDVYRVVTESPKRSTTVSELVTRVDSSVYQRKVRSMITVPEGPKWLSGDPETKLQSLIDSGEKSILLYGPPRTGKTHAIDSIIPASSTERTTIQIHDGWGYEDLMLGLLPNDDGVWEYNYGPLLEAIVAGQRYIVLEEINRTSFSQAIGEVFLRLEKDYRGEQYTVTLRDESELFVPEDVIIFLTMNTVDRSTEEIDDALLGRVAAVEFLPRVESLHRILDARGVDEGLSQDLRELFVAINRYYPLGHAYFSGFQSDSDPVAFYLSHIRPVLQKHLQNYRDDELATIDEIVDRLFS